MKKRRVSDYIGEIAKLLPGTALIGETHSDVIACYYRNLGRVRQRETPICTAGVRK